MLWGISLKAPRGQLTTIVGANGAGKTTTLRAVTGSIAPWEGRVIFDGEDVTRLPAHAKAARGLVLVPEGRQLFGAMSVEDNLEMGAYSQARRRANTRSGSSRSSAFSRASPSGGASTPAPCPAASSRCWRSPAA